MIFTKEKLQNFKSSIGPRSLLDFIAFNLGVTDILYEKKTKKNNKVGESEPYVLNDPKNDQGSIKFEDADDKEETDLIPELRGVVSKARNIIGKFTGSHVQNDYLQTLVKEALGHELSLAKDMKTRWSSLVVMLEKFLRILPQIRIAWLMSENSWPLSPEEITTLDNLVLAMKPLELAVVELSRRSMDLLGAEAVYETTIQELTDLDTNIAKTLRDSFEKRVQERRQPTLVHLIEYLKDPSYINPNLCEAQDQFGNTIQKDAVHSKASVIIQHLFPEYRQEGDETENRNDSQETQIDTQQLTMAQKFRLNIQKSQEVRSKRVKKSQSLDAAFNEFELTGTRPTILEHLFQALRGIPVSSVEAERCFSTTGTVYILGQ